MVPEACPRCGSKRLRGDTWLCENCLNTAKEETLRLVDDFLISDLGLSLQDMFIVFSGHRGYHVHVRNHVVRELTQDGRREITDYVRGVGLLPRFHGFSRQYLSSRPPDLAGRGWSGKLIRSLYNLIATASSEDLLAILRNRRLVEIIIKNKSTILRAFESSPPRWPAVKGVSIRSWEKLASAVVDNAAVHIDERVTSDIKRLMRLPMSLHGKTGFRVVPLTIESSTITTLLSFKTPPTALYFSLVEKSLIT